MSENPTPTTTRKRKDMDSESPPLKNSELVEMSSNVTSFIDINRDYIPNEI